MADRTVADRIVAGRTSSAGPGEVRWGFVGAGFVASRALAPAVHAASGARLQTVAARSGRRAWALAPAGSATTSYAAVVEDPGVDVVYVALSNEAHRPWVLAALAAGKHVLCEKPLGLSAGEVAELTSAARAADRMLVEATWTRWHPRTRRAEQLVAEGALGRVELVDAAFTFGGVPQGSYRLDPARGGGALLDVGGYLVSGVRWALGGDLSGLAVTSASRRTGPTGVDLETVAELVDGSGAQVRLRASIDADEHQHLRVTGESTVLDLLGPAITSWREPSELVIGGHVERFAPVDAYQLMVEAVSARVRGAEAWVVPPQESLDVARTLDAVAAAAA